MSFHWSIYIASKPRFKLTDGKNRSDVYCVSCFNAQDLEIGNSPNSLLNIGIDVLGIMGLPFNIYYVQIFTNDRDERPWQLLIDNYRSQAILKKYIDCLAKRRSEYYSLVPVTKIEQNRRIRHSVQRALNLATRAVNR